MGGGVGVREQANSGNMQPSTGVAAQLAEPCDGSCPQWRQQCGSIAAKWMPI